MTRRVYSKTNFVDAEVAGIEFARRFDYDVIVQITGSVVILAVFSPRCVDEYRSLQVSNKQQLQSRDDNK